MVRLLIISLSLVIYTNVNGQEELAITKEQQITEMKVDRHFQWKYKHRLKQLRRTYPMALKAQELISQYEKDLADLNKKRKKKKYGKDAHNELKDEFTYNIRDLYESEGDLLMKLIHRETGMTVNEIIKKYRGGLQTGIYSGLAKLWGHNLDDTYDPDGEDWITEVVINDIESGKIAFDKKMAKLDKKEFKDGMKEYRNNRKESRKSNRKSKRNKKRVEHQLLFY